MSAIVADLRFAIRALRRQPGFASASVLTLALGIGITTAMFSVLNGVLLRPLPFPRSDRLITLCEQHQGATPEWCSISTPNVLDVGSRSRSIEAIGVGRTWGYHLATDAGLRAVTAGIVTPGAFAALGVRPYAGRLFTDEDLIGAPSVVTILSYELWQSQFGSDPGVVGRMLDLDGVSVAVIGIAPPGLELPRFEAVDLWRPLHFRPEEERVRGWPGFVAYGRLREGVSVAAARSEVNAIASELKARHFASSERWSITTQSLQDLVVGRVKPAILMLFAAVIGVLLIGCANVANLLLVRANARAREIAVRQAVGGGRFRVARGLLVESVVLALAGAALGILIAVWGTSAFKRLAPAGIPRVDEVYVDGTALLFTLGLAFTTAMVFGLVPALRATRADLSRALREGGRGSSGGVGRLGTALVVLQLALAVTLVSGAGLLVRTFAGYSRWDPGFDRSQLVMFALSAPEVRYPTSSHVAALWSRVETELASLPGVVSVATASAGPLFGGDGSAPIALEGRATPGGATAAWFDISPDWFRTLGVPLVAGRYLEESDRIGGERVALVNERFAQRNWPGESAIGRRFTMKDRELQLTVVGVVRDVPALRPGEPTSAEVYWSNRQLPRPFTYVMVRAATPATLAQPIAARLASIDPALEPSGLRRYDELVAARLKRPRFTMLLLVGFGAAAVTLAAVGVYGLLVYIVSMKQREIGIRLALGAQRSRVFATQLLWGARVAGIGIALGLAVALALARAVESQVAGVSARDPLTLGLSAGAILLIALIACLLPARRASGVDPATVLGAD